MPIEEWKNRLISTSQFPHFNYGAFQTGEKKYPFAMICLLIDENIMIAVGCDPLSPSDFRIKNHDAIFQLDLTVPPLKTDTMHGFKTIYYAKRVD